MKRCCTCKTDKPESEFSRNKSTSDGLQARCKACVCAYFEANREKLAEYKRAYYEANREKIAERERAYREANREKIAEYRRCRHEANREKIAEYKRAWHEANREKIAEKKREYYEANREKLVEKQRAWREANPGHYSAYFEANREKLAEYKRAYNEANREKVLEKKRAYNEAKVREAADTYIKSLIADALKTSATKVPPELVELKRQHLTLHRAVQTLEGAINEKRNQNHRPTARHAGRRGQASDGR